MSTLTPTVVALLSRLTTKSDAKRIVSYIPLGSICWDDEMPDHADLLQLSESERSTIWRLFALRFRIWDREVLSNEDTLFWESARAEAPTWALFGRLSLSPDDRLERSRTEAAIEKEFEALFQDAEQVDVVEKGHGIQEFSATFDLANTDERDPKS